MFKANRLLAIIVLFLFVGIMGSCGGGGGSNGGGDGNDQSTVPVQGNITPVQGDIPTEYEVFNSYGSSTPDTNGNFIIPVSETNLTFTYAVSDSGNKVYAAVTEPNAPNVTTGAQISLTIDAQSTAEALVLLNPLLIPDNKARFSEVIQVVKSNSAVNNLASVINNLYLTSSDPLSDEQLTNAVSDAVISVLNSLQVSNATSQLSKNQSLYQFNRGINQSVRYSMSSTSASPTTFEYDMGALNLQNSYGSTIKIDIAEVGPGGIKTNVTWVAEIIELDPTKIQWFGDEFIFNPDLVDTLIKTDGYRKKVIVEGEIASGFLELLVNPLSKISEAIGGILFPKDGINPGYDGVYAVIALSGSPFGDGSEYAVVKNIAWQRELWAEALSTNIISAALDTIGVGCAIIGVDISPLLKEQFLLIKALITDNPEIVGLNFFIDETANVADKLLDFLRPYIHSQISELQSAGLKKFFHVAINTAKRVIDTWSGTVEASTRLLNLVFNVTPRESGYVITSPSDIIPDTTPPSVPINITAIAVSKTQIDLSWSASSDDFGVAGYKIYRDGIPVKSVTTTSTSDTGLSASTQYCYTVSAYDTVGNESDQSSQVCTTTLSTPDTTPPSVPTGLTATAVSSSQIDLSWNASTDNIGVAGYKIYDYYGTYLNSVTSTSTSITGLNSNTYYCFSVSAYDAAGNESGQSSQACATTLSTSSPQILASGLSLPRGIAVDATSVYWTESSGWTGTIKKVGINGGSVTTLASGLSGIPVGIAVDSTSVYWIECYFSGSGSVKKVGINGGTVTTLASGLNGLRDIAVDSTSVYWTENPGSIIGNTVKKVGINGGSVTILASGLCGEDGIVVDSTSVYWPEGCSGSVKKVGINGGTVTTIVVYEPGGPWGIAVDSSSVYWTEYYGGSDTVKKVGINGGTVTTLASGISASQHIAVDSSSVYWTENGSGTVKKVGINGGAVTTLASGQNFPYAIAVDSTSVYWTELNSSGTIKKVPKGGSDDWWQW